MKSKPIQHITKEQFIRDCSRFPIDNLPDGKTYREFVKYFKGIPKISFHHMVIGINFTYGWMPTAFDFRSDDYSAAVKILNQAKEGYVLTEEQLTILKGLFNNSLVGTTKLLHFINPAKYAIWDSRVCRYYIGKEPNQNRISNCQVYLSYLDFCRNIAKNKTYNEVHQSVCEQQGYRVSKLRSIDLLMYLQGGKKGKVREWYLFENDDDSSDVGESTSGIAGIFLSFSAV